MSLGSGAGLVGQTPALPEEERTDSVVCHLSVIRYSSRPEVRAENPGGSH